MSWKADSVTIPTENENAQQFEPHPTGSFIGRCVDVVDMGEAVEQYEGNPEKIVRKVALVFVTGETREFDGKQELIALIKEVSLTFGEKSNLRKLMETWRSKGYAEDEIADIDVGKMAGVFGVITVGHKVSKKNRTYANILSVTPLVKGMAKDDSMGRTYERPKYLTDKKLAYAAEVAQFKRKIGADKPQPVATVKSDFTAPPALTGDDLPFDV